MKTYQELNDLVDSDPLALRDYAAGLQRELVQAREQRDTALRAAQERTNLHDASERGNPAAYPASAGEFAARWNAKSVEQREDWRAALIIGSDRAVTCMREDHAGELAHLRKQVAPLTIEWAFEAPSVPGMMYVTRNAMLFETMIAGRPDAKRFSRMAPEWSEMSR
jgi:hypothetical protein